MTLNDLILSYYEQKLVLDKQQKDVLQLGKQIKDTLTADDLYEYESDGIVVTISEINKDVLDEDALIAEIRDTFPSVVKTKEYVDMDELENLVYTRQIDPDLVQRFIIKKEPTIRLNIKKRKEKENGSDNNDSCNT